MLSWLLLFVLYCFPRMVKRPSGYDPLTYIICSNEDGDEAERQARLIFADFEALYGARIQNVYQTQLNELFAPEGLTAYLFRFLVAPAREITLPDNVLLSYELYLRKSE